MDNRTTIFDFLYPTYKIDKPIRLIEFFAGYGSQALALKYLNVPFEHYKICEWNYKSMKAYREIHFPDKEVSLKENIKKEDMVKFLLQKGISSNWNEPMSEKSIKQLSEEHLKEIIKDIAITNNLVNIQQVKGKDLCIKDKDKFTYLLTYSFPCQDLSLAGLKKGMDDTSTRSGMLWEVERILKELKEMDQLPQLLLMENVPQVHGVDNLDNFNKWKLELEKLGYTSYFQDLIATDYGIPQIRNRCFMVSILGQYNYNFPKPIPLKLRLKDMLEDNVDEKYYLSDKMIQGMMNTNFESYKLENKLLDKEGNANTIIARYEGTPQLVKDTENYVEWREKGKFESDTRAYKEDKVSGAITTTPKSKVLIKNNTKQGYLEAEEGDGVNISSRMEYQRGNVQKGMAQTITTMGGENVGVVVKEDLKRQLCNELIESGKVKENDVIRHSYTNSRFNEWEKRNVEKNNISPTLDTRCDCLGVVNKMRIRKLTPKECFRLQGVKDEDSNRITASDSTKYHLAGDSIVVDVLMAIFKEML